MVDVKLILGDCLEVMKTMPDKSVDAVITDPQYEKEAHTTMRRTRATIENRADAAAMPFQQMDEITRSLSVGYSLKISKGWALVFSQAEAVGKYYELFGDSWRRSMVWIKPDSSPQFTGDRPSMGYESICAAWCGDGKSRWNGGGTRGVFSYNCSDYDHVHPAQKPLKLMQRLINLFTNPGETILDPFMGSGTTGVACVQTGRNFIGIEISPEYYKIAEKRIHDAQQQLSLF